MSVRCCSGCSPPPPTSFQPEQRPGQQKLGRKQSVAGLSCPVEVSLCHQREADQRCSVQPVCVSGEMGKSVVPTEQSLQGEGHRDLEMGAKSGTEGNPSQEQCLLTESLCSNGDARGARDSGSPSPSRDPSVRKALICVSVLAAVLFIIVLALAVEKYKAPVVAQRVGCVTACPNDGWIGYPGKCYYFSEAEGNWASSQKHCSSLGASLAGIDTPQEMDFMLDYRGHREHWIGLRNRTGPHWRWVNGTEFNNCVGRLWARLCVRASAGLSLPGPVVGGKLAAASDRSLLEELLRALLCLLLSVAPESLRPCAEYSLCPHVSHRRRRGVCVSEGRRYRQLLTVLYGETLDLQQTPNVAWHQAGC